MQSYIGFNCGKVQTQNEPNIIDIIKSLYLMWYFWVHFEWSYTQNPLISEWLHFYTCFQFSLDSESKTTIRRAFSIHLCRTNMHFARRWLSQMTCLCSPCPHLPGSQVKPPLGCKTDLPHITSQLVSYCGSHSLGHQRRTQKTVQSLLQPERQSFIEQTPRSRTENPAGKLLISIVYHCFRSVSTHSWSRKRFIDI